MTVMTLDEIRAAAVSIGIRCRQIVAVVRAEIAVAELEIQRIRSCPDKTLENRLEINRLRGVITGYQENVRLNVGRSYSADTLVSMIDQGLLTAVLGEREPTDAEWPALIYSGLAYRAVMRLPPDPDIPPGWYNVLRTLVVDMYRQITSQNG